MRTCAACGDQMPESEFRRKANECCKTCHYLVNRDNSRRFKAENPDYWKRPEARQRRKDYRTSEEYKAHRRQKYLDDKDKPLGPDEY